MNRWITSFLTDRRMSVQIGDSLSDTFTLYLGTPQGSILAPLIFILFVNDLSEHILSGSVFAYADDTTVVVSGSDVQTVLLKGNLMLTEFSSWCKTNNLMINHSKTICMQLKTSRRVPAYLHFDFDGHSLQMENSSNFLGVTLDTNFIFDKHIDTHCNKLNSHYYLLKSLKPNVDQKTLMNVYYATCFSSISYNIIIWGLSSDIDRVLVAQKRIIRLIFDLRYDQSCRNTFFHKKRFTVISIYLYKLLIFIYKKNPILP